MRRPPSPSDLPSDLSSYLSSDLIVPLVLLSVVLCAGPPAFAQGAGEVISQQKISATGGGFLGPLSNGDQFGFSISRIGDLNDDGVDDVAVGSRFDGDGGFNRGAVWILFLNSDGTVGAEQKISQTQGGFTGVLGDGDEFGRAVASLSDLDGDLVEDIAVAAYRDDDGGLDRGAVWILFLNTDGTVKSHQKISDVQGGFTGVLDDDDRFGHSMAGLGNLDGALGGDLIVTAHRDDDGGVNRGAAWVLFLNTNGTVSSHQKISHTEGGFTGGLADNDFFGRSAVVPGDVDGDGIIDVVIGAPFDDDGGADRGAVWVLFLETDGTVRGHRKISNTSGTFSGVLDDADLFGFSVAGLGDLDQDGKLDIVVGAAQDDDGGVDRGAAWVLFLDATGRVLSHQKISDTQGNFTGGLSDNDIFASGVEGLGDLNGDGVMELAVGVPEDDDGGVDRGSVWILSLCDGFGTVSLGSVVPVDGSELGDNHINIFGSGFTAASDTTVLFGGIPGVVTDVIPGRVAVRTPPGVGVVDVEVSNCLGSAILPSAFTYEDPAIAARFGNVNVGLGSREDVVFLNGSAGNAERIVDVAAGSPFFLDIVSPSNRLTATFCLWAWIGIPDDSTITSMPSDVGRVVYAPPFAGGAPQRIFNRILDFKAQLGCSDFVPPTPAPIQLFSRSGRARPAIVTFHGIIRDSGSRIPEKYSVMNAVIFRNQ